MDLYQDKQFSNEIGNNNNSDLEKDKKKNSKDSPKSLKDNEQEINTNLKEPEPWVKSWVDDSYKYGFGYLLNNDFCGMIFTDNSKMILNPYTNQFNYIETRDTDKQEIISKHTMNDYPNELERKARLLKHFSNYLLGKYDQSEKQIQNTNEGNEDKDKKDKEFIYVKNWWRTKDGLFFSFSNKNVQVCFQDKTEIIISSGNLLVTYKNNKGEKNTYPFSTALEMSDYEIIKRLKYTQDILTYLINKKKEKDSNQESKKTSKNNENEKDLHQP